MAIWFDVFTYHVSELLVVLRSGKEWERRKVLSNNVHVVIAGNWLFSKHQANVGSYFFDIYFQIFYCWRCLSASLTPQGLFQPKQLSSQIIPMLSNFFFNMTFICIFCAYNLSNLSFRAKLGIFQTNFRLFATAR